MSGETTEEQKRRSVRPVDFRLPRSFERSHLRGVELLLESASRPSATLMGAALRRNVKIELDTIDQLSWESLLSELTGSGLVITFALHPLASRATIFLPAEVALRLIDLRLGGDGEWAEVDTRELTDLEQNLAAKLFEDMVTQVAAAISTQTAVVADRIHTEPSLEFIQGIPLGEMCVWAKFRFSLGDDRLSELSMVLPYSMLRPVVETISSRAVVMQENGTDFQAAFERRLQEVPVVARVRLESTTISSQAFLRLKPGDVVGLGHRKNRPMSVVVDRVELYKAVLGQSGSRVAAIIVGEEE
jgi:flagellar motor switch protein FliM